MKIDIETKNKIHIELDKELVPKYFFAFGYVDNKLYNSVDGDVRVRKILENFGNILNESIDTDSEKVAIDLDFDTARDLMYAIGYVSKRLSSVDDIEQGIYTTFARIANMIIVGV